MKRKTTLTHGDRNDVRVKITVETITKNSLTQDEHTTMHKGLVDSTMLNMHGARFVNANLSDIELSR